MQVSAKKKNNDNELTFAEDYPLPELPQNITPAGATNVKVSGAVASPVVSTAAMPATSVEGDRVNSESVSGATVSANGQMSATQVAQSQSVATATTQQPIQQPTQQPTHIPPRRSALAGFSLSELLNSTTTLVEQAEEKKKSAEEIYIDPKSEWKLKEHRQKIVESILHERPRFVVAFESMQIDGHIIKLEVPSQTLYEEIMRSKTEILMQMAREAEVEGMLDMQIVVNEQIKASRPIKLEDRIHFMTEKNPLLTELKRVLEMEYE